MSKRAWYIFAAIAAFFAWTAVCGACTAAVLIGQAGKWDDDIIGLGVVACFWFMGIAIAAASIGDSVKDVSRGRR